MACSKCGGTITDERMFKRQSGCNICGGQFGNEQITLNANGFLLRENYLGEFMSKFEKEMARKNLGIDLEAFKEEILDCLEAEISNLKTQLEHRLELLVFRELANLDIVKYLERINENINSKASSDESIEME